MTKLFCFLALMCCTIGCSKKHSDKEIGAQQIYQVTIYYIEWSVETFRSLSCEDLQRNGDSIIVREIKLIENLTRAMEVATLTPLPEHDDIDARVCCIFRDSSENVLHSLSFSPPPVMKLDGKVFERDRRLFEVVLSLLPSDYLKGWSID